MVFTQFAFAVFLLVSWVGYWWLPRNTSRKIWLLAASYFFYGYWDYRFLALIGFFTLLNFAAVDAMERTTNDERRKRIITATVVGNLAVLGFFKYFDFFVTEVGSGLQLLGFRVSAPTLEIVLPVGISFITFQSMSLSVDVFRRQMGRRALLDVALFIAFFPQLVAGPIVRATDFLDQLETNRSYSQVPLRGAVGLFLVGYFKKACVADNIAAAIDPLFAEPRLYDLPSRVLGGILYSAQIYCDFSGYTDMAIATSALFGYQLIKNFDAPYLSHNIQEFWQRWHISLSTWLRDYLYIPLGGNRGPAWFVTRNLLLTMLLGGLWHGANWTFLLWGLLHGVALVIHRNWGRFVGKQGAPSRYFAFGAWLLTISWVVFCFTIFRTANIEIAWEYFTVQAQGNRLLRVWDGWWLLLAVLATVHYAVYRLGASLAAFAMRMPLVAYCIGWGAIAGFSLYMSPLNLSAFIYFQF